MTTRFEIIEAKPWHCGAMTRMLRLEHQKAVAMIGIDSHRELRGRFDDSTFRRAWMIDGKLAALGGVTGSRLSSIGYIWLAFSSASTKYPIEMVKESRRQMAAIMTVKRRIYTTILDGDTAAKRFAIFLGFVPADDEMQRPAASRFGRAELNRRFDTNSEARIPIGASFAVAMAYRAQESA
jgi:hypothetical protein